jgi:signal transduction histidine kinase/Tfp pilus assembly protein PilF
VYLTVRLCIFTIILSLLISDAFGARLVNDKSGDHPILEAEKLKIETLIGKADHFAEIKSDSCLIYAEEAFRLARANNSPELQAGALDVLVNYYYGKEQYAKVLEHAPTLIELYAIAGDSSGKAKAYNLYGLASFNTGVYDEAIRAYHNTMRLALELRDNYLVAMSYQNIGVLYTELDRPREAMDYYQKALDLYRILKDRDGEAGAMQNMGIIYSNDKKYREALGYYLSALKVYEDLKDSISMALMYLNLGSLYEEQKEYEKSLTYYNKAILISLNENYKYGIAYSYFSLGSIYRKTGDYDAALGNLQKSLQYSKMISLVENEIDCHKELSNVFFALGDYKTAFEELKDYNTLHDSLFSENVQQSIAEVEMRFKTEMKDREIEGLKTARQQAIKDMIRRTIGLISIVTLTIIVIAVTMYYSRTIKKSNVMLTAEVEDRIKAEKELISIKENLEERVSARTRELEKAKVRAEESDRLKSAFIANMSHEIRTPLNAITGFSGLLLREDIPTEKRREYNDHVIKNNKILVNMIEDLIDTSKIESGNLQLHPSLINVRQFLYRLNEPILDNLARKNKHKIDVMMDNPEINADAIVADPVRLQQVLWHILDNAVKFTREGSIHYGCIENHEKMIFYVNDSGIGIPDEHKDVVFDKFRQIDESAKRKFGGTGLGLYYARKIAEMMGGKLWFEPKKEGGSIFYFAVPQNFTQS